MDDAALMASLAAGDHAAMGKLYDRYGRQVYALTLRMLQESTTAEEATQESFLQAWRKAAQFDATREPLATWILHIAYTAAVDALRKQGRPDRSEAPPDLAADAQVEALGAQAREALLRLPSELRQALELAYFGAMSPQQIAAVLGLPLGAAKGRVRSGLESLRRFLLAPRRKEVDSRVDSLSQHR